MSTFSKYYKTGFFVFLALLATSGVRAVEVGETYAFTLSISLSRANLDGTAYTDSGATTSAISELFEVRNITANHVVIRILNYSNSAVGEANETIHSEKVFDAATGTNFLWLISINSFDLVAERYHRIFDFEAGTLILPIKIRLGGQNAVQLPMGQFDRLPDFTSGFNAGLALGGKMRLGHHTTSSLSLLVGGSITSITVDSITTAGYASKQTEQLGFSGHISLVGHFRSTYLVGSLGWDVLGGPEGKNWGYNKAPWVGVGVGINLFESNSTGIAEN